MLCAMEQIQHVMHGTGIRDRRMSPLLVRGWLDWAAGPEELAAYGRAVDRAAARLVRAANPAGMVTRFLASAHDGLYVGAARDAEAALGPPPCPYALLVLGSGARPRAPCGPARTMPWSWTTTRLRGPAPGSRPWPNGWRPSWSAVVSPATALAR
jgi:hypothetical protein